MHYIFLVHGMGNWASKWSEDAQEIIRRHYKKDSYAFLGAKWPFDQHFRFEELNFNDLFEEYLEAAKKQANLEEWGKLNSVLEGGLLGVLGRFVDMAKTPPNKDNFAVTHLADVALFMATDLGELVKNAVALKLVERLDGLGFGAGDRWSVIAHSLGTRVITEVLQLGFTAQPSLRNYGKAQVVMMVSNVSKLLEGIPPWNVAGNVYHNAVFPSADAIGACDHYINVTHRFDPFAFIREFDPPADFGDGNAFIDEVYHPIKLAMTDITSKEIHSLEHYLEHPHVHTTLFRYLVSPKGNKKPTEQELKDAMEVYRLNALGAQVTDAWRDALEKLKRPSYENFKEIYQAWEKYGALLK